MPATTGENIATSATLLIDSVINSMTKISTELTTKATNMLVPRICQLKKRDIFIDKDPKNPQKNSHIPAP